MQNLTIKEYSKAKDLSSVTLRDETPYGTAGFPARNLLALVVLIRRKHAEFSHVSQEPEFLTITTGIPPLADTVVASNALVANGIRVPLPEPGVYEVYTFAVKRFSEIANYPGGVLEIGNIYYNTNIDELVRIIGYNDIEMTDEYAQSFDYTDLPELLQAEADYAAANALDIAYLVPRHSYETEIVSDKYALLDTTTDYALTHILSQKRLREIAAAWWYLIFKNRKKKCSDEMYEYYNYAADLEGVCARFEAGYFNDAAEIMDSLVTRGIEINNELKSY